MGSLPPLPPDEGRSLPEEQRSEEPVASERIHDTYEPGRPATLSAEQLEYYRKRIESGYYRSPEVLDQIAERMTDDLLSPEKDRRR